MELYFTVNDMMERLFNRIEKANDRNADVVCLNIIRTLNDWTLAGIKHEDIQIAFDDIYKHACACVFSRNSAAARKIRKFMEQGQTITVNGPVLKCNVTMYPSALAPYPSAENMKFIGRKTVNRMPQQRPSGWN